MPGLGSGDILRSRVRAMFETGAGTGGDFPDQVLARKRRAMDEVAAAELDEAVAQCLDPVRPHLVAWAVRYFQSAPPPDDGGGLLALFGDVDMFATLPDPVPTGRRTLRAEIACALAQRLRGRPAIRNAVRAEALRPLRAGPVVAGLFADDRDWLLAHAEAICAASPEATMPLLWNLRAAGFAVRPWISKLASRVEPAVLLAAIDDVTSDARERAALRAALPTSG